MWRLVRKVANLHSYELCMRTSKLWSSLVFVNLMGENDLSILIFILEVIRETESQCIYY